MTVGCDECLRSGDQTNTRFVVMFVCCCLLCRAGVCCALGMLSRGDGVMVCRYVRYARPGLEERHSPQGYWCPYVYYVVTCGVGAELVDPSRWCQAEGQGLHRSVPLDVESPHDVQCQGPAGTWRIWDRWRWRWRWRLS